MNTDWLNNYITLIETGSFSRAAEIHSISHTSFARRIRQLEAWAGTPLIENTQPIKPTPAGLIVLGLAQEVFEKLLHTQSQLKQAHNAKEILTIATGRTLASNFFPKWYKDIIAKTGFTHMSVMTAGTEFAALRFAQKQADLLLSYQTPMVDMILAKEFVDSHILGNEKIIPVAASKNTTDIEHLLKKHTHLHKVNWLNYDKSLSLKSVVVGFLSRKQILLNLNPVFESDNYETLKAMVLEGVGIAWLPYTVVEPEIKSKKLFIIGDSQLQIPVDIILYKFSHRNDTPLHNIWQAVTQK